MSPSSLSAVEVATAVLCWFEAKTPEEQVRFLFEGEAHDYIREKVAIAERGPSALFAKLDSANRRRIVADATKTYAAVKEIVEPTKAPTTSNDHEAKLRVQLSDAIDSFHAIVDRAEEPEDLQDFEDISAMAKDAILNARGCLALLDGKTPPVEDRSEDEECLSVAKEPTKHRPGQHEDESAVEYLRRVVQNLNHEEESLLDELPCVEAALEFFDLWRFYDTEFWEGILQAIADGDDAEPIESFIKRWGLPESWSRAVARAVRIHEDTRLSAMDEPEKGGAA